MALLKIQEPGQSEAQQAVSEVIVGIDLGTTNSLIGVIEDKKVRLFGDENGDMIPSVVAYDELGNVVAVGFEALAKKSATAISSVKRLMGKNFDDVKEQKFPFAIQQELAPNKSLRINVGGRKILAEEVSAEILKHLKNLAEKALKTEIKKAVITVPAYFDEAAKNATKLAANIADLEVVRLVSEPTAAALAYGLDNASEGTYCVYDLGGGTFDVSILKMQKGVFKVLGVAGDNQLGGDDFDEAIVEKFPHLTRDEAKKIKEELSREIAINVLAPDGGSTPVRNVHALRETDVISEAKCETFRTGVEPPSGARSGVMSEPPSSGSAMFTRDDFEKLIAPKIEKTVALTKNLLDDLELSELEIKGVILVGGSTRIPLIRKKLSEIFGEEEILTNLDPDRVVAIGAAWQAHNLNPASHADEKNLSRYASTGKNLLLDVVPLSLGIEMMGGIVDKIIHRNTTIPTAYSKEFTTYADNQTGMKFHIVQGERELAADCRSLANFEIKGIPAMQAGLARVQIVFKVDADGLLTITAQEKITGKKQEIIVKPSYGLDENEVKKMLLDSLQNSQSDMENRLLIETLNEAKKDIVIIRNDLKKFAATLASDEKNLIEKNLKNLEKLIEKKSARDLILVGLKALEKSAENLVLQKVNAALQQKITGKKVEEI